MKLFVKDPPSPDGIFRLDRKARKRIVKVMRMGPGDVLRVFARGQAWECTISQVDPEGVELRTVRRLPMPVFPVLHLTLAQAIPKGDRLEWLIQKATEIGVSEIVPLFTGRTIRHPRNTTQKLQRWNEIAEHAAAQSENAFPALVRQPQPLSDFLQDPSNGLKLLLHEREGAVPLREILKSYDDNSIIFLVGPEGGWTPEESRSIWEAGYHPIHLGPRILRSETAGLVLAAILQYERGDFT